jgi:hypothetical protein
MGMYHEQLQNPGKVGWVSVLVSRFNEHLELLQVNYRDGGFQHDLSSKGHRDYIEESLGDCYISGEMYSDILKIYPVVRDEYEYFEIIGDVFAESWKSWTDCGWEYDACEWIENPKYLKLKEKI